MVLVGNMPIIWHIMKNRSCDVINDLVVQHSFTGCMIKAFFNRYHLYSIDLTLEVGKGIANHVERAEDWKITLVDAYDYTQTRCKLRRLKGFIGDNDFCVTCGDGLADVSFFKLIPFCKTYGVGATLGETHTTARFGALSLDGYRVRALSEKLVAATG